MTENQQAVTEVAKESPEAAGLIYGLITASMDANNRTMDTLYDRERERRMALEVRIEEFVDRAARSWGGSTREYETLIDTLRYPALDDHEYAARHRENEAR